MVSATSAALTLVGLLVITPIPARSAQATGVLPTAGAASHSAAMMSRSGLRSLLQYSCTGQGTYYSSPDPSTFYCPGRGLAGPYSGLPTIALNGVDMTDDDCGKCIVFSGTGETAQAAAAAGEGTTPFPAGPNYATIDNQCPECSHCDIDYYTGSTQTKNGRYTVSWDYIDCAQALQQYNAQQSGSSSRKLLRNKSPATHGSVAWP